MMNDFLAPGRPLYLIQNLPGSLLDLMQNTAHPEIFRSVFTGLVFSQVFHKLLSQLTFCQFVECPLDSGASAFFGGMLKKGRVESVHQSIKGWFVHILYSNI